MKKKTKRGGYNGYKCPNPKCPTNKELEVSKEDMKLIGEKGTHPTQMTFQQRIQAIRNMRRRKQHQHKEKAALLTPSFSPTTVVPEDEIKASEKQPKIAVGVVNYKCKACGEKFEGETGIDKCLICDSKDIEIVENKTVTK